LNPVRRKYLSYSFPGKLKHRIPLPHGHGSVNWRLLQNLLANEVSG
jgi:hypothetical protein